MLLTVVAPGELGGGDLNCSCCEDKDVELHVGVGRCLIWI
jgi:hypothetical protein